jgi:O-antigen/teichoic acid export membrane protein
MRQKITAFFLSALVFPGLGQLYNQDRRKGVILVLAANGLLGLTLLIGLILISQEYTTVFYPRPLTGEMIRLLLLDTLRHPLFWAPFGLLLALWGYAVVDAVRHAGPPAQE